MKKYIYKQSIEACQYEDGMETGWKVLFTGNFFDYEKKFKEKQQALNFIENNDGINEVDIDDTHYDIDYEEPIPYLWDSINGFLPIYHNDDYIVRYPTGRIEILPKKEFESLFKLSEEERKYDKFGLPLKLNSIPMPPVKKPKEEININKDKSNLIIPDYSYNIENMKHSQKPVKLIHKKDGFHFV